MRWQSEENRTIIRLAAFLLAIVPTSITVSFAAFVDSGFLLALGLLPCVITLAISIVPTPVSARTVLLCGIVSFIISSSIVLYTLIAHADKIKYYLPLPFL
jgi:hypothetical protein